MELSDQEKKQISDRCWYAVERGDPTPEHIDAYLRDEVRDATESYGALDTKAIRLLIFAIGLALAWPSLSVSASWQMTLVVSGLSLIAAIAAACALAPSTLPRMNDSYLFGEADQDGDYWYRRLYAETCIVKKLLRINRQKGCTLSIAMGIYAMALLFAVVALGAL